MTAARIRGSKLLMSNSETGVERLEGVTAFVEDWHCFPWGKAYSMLITLYMDTITQNLVFSITIGNMETFVLGHFWS